MAKNALMMKVPEHLIVTLRDQEVRVWFDFDPGEDQWFDARAGVGSPGYPASIDNISLDLDNTTKSDWVLTDAELEDAEQQIWDQLNKMWADREF
jgi:hypothetical protein